MVKRHLCDCDYNMIKQMSKKLEVLWYIDNYIKDAKKDGHKDCVKLLEEIKKDETKHALKMKELLGKKLTKKKKK